MVQHRRSVFILAILTWVAVVPSAPAHADSVVCQKTIAKSLLKLKNSSLKEQVKCLRKQNLDRISGPCPDGAAQLKIQAAADKATLGIAERCTSADLAALNYRTDCAYRVATTGEEADCAALPVLNGPDIDPTLLAQCLECWKATELSQYTAILYASHALEVCGGSLSATSTVCAPLDCTTPLPDQRDLTDAEGDCQHGIGKAGWKYLIKRQKALERCALAGMTQAQCATDVDLQAKLAKYRNSMQAKIHRKCGNRDPLPSPPFCCRTGIGNQCTVATDRADCEFNIMGEVQEDKTCNAGDCDSVMGNKAVTWWGFCPKNASCPGPALSTLDDLMDCVDSSASTLNDDFLCLQFRGNNGTDWPCPP